MYLNKKIIILVERIPVLYMTFTSPGYGLGISMRCMELLHLYKHIFHVLAIQLFGVWQVSNDFFFFITACIPFSLYITMAENSTSMSLG